MIRKNMMNVLLAAVVVSAALVGYNAFIAGSDNGHTATHRISEYLSLDSAEQEQTDGTVAVTGEQTITSADTTPTTQSVTVAPNENTEGSVAVTQTPAAPTTTASSPSGDRAEKVYTVKDGDTYGCIAEKYYGSFEHWVDIAYANPIGNVGFTEYGLHVGAQIVLPAIGSAALKPSSTLCS